MKSVELQRRITAPAILALCLPAALIEKFSGRFTIQGSNFIFQDPFHQGEYFAVAQSLSDTAPPPLSRTIHSWRPGLHPILTGLHPERHQLQLSAYLLSLLSARPDSLFATLYFRNSPIRPATPRLTRTVSGFVSGLYCRLPRFVSLAVPPAFLLAEQTRIQPANTKSTASGIRSEHGPGAGLEL